jgi:hypothetical protein
MASLKVQSWFKKSLKNEPVKLARDDIRQVKYVFLDVVAYSTRTIETQCSVIQTLNRLVKETVKTMSVDEKDVIYLPTGDGVCIALINPELTFDVHISTAKGILCRINKYNESQLEKERFEVRIGINQCEDNILSDINGMRNVAGSGVNMARRIMDLADGGQILLSRAVFDLLAQRSKYSKAFRELRNAHVKHTIIDVYQLIDEGACGLNNKTPEIFVHKEEPESEFPVETALYFAYCIKNQEFILSKMKEWYVYGSYLQILFWFLVKESIVILAKTETDTYERHVLPEEMLGLSINDQLEWLKGKLPCMIAIHISFVLNDKIVPPMFKKFVVSNNALVITKEGKAKLDTEYPNAYSRI